MMSSKLILEEKQTLLLVVLSRYGELSEKSLGAVLYLERWINVRALQSGKIRVEKEVHNGKS